MEPLTSKTPIDKVKDILQAIEIVIKSLLIKNNKGLLIIDKFKKNIEQTELFKNLDMCKISSINKTYIKMEEFKEHKKFYRFLYNFFLNKIYNYSQKQCQYIVLFQSFNQVYFYAKYIKYIREFIKKYPETIKDDIMKEKLFEIVHSLESDDKLYFQDFYFYISMHHIHYYYKKNDISIPEFKKFDDENTDNGVIKHNLVQILNDKRETIDDLITYIKCINSRSDLIRTLSDILNELERNISITGKNYESLIKHCTFTEKEQKFIEYLGQNESNSIIKKVEDTYFNCDLNLKERFQFYYKDAMNDFLSLSEEDKYIILNSSDIIMKFHNQCLNYKSLKESYDKGIKEENVLKPTIEKIIEDKNFYELIKDILNSGKVLDYCCNPIQYIKNDKNIINKLDERKVEISRFELDKSQSENKKNLYNLLEKECDKIKNYKCNFQINYEYFLNNVFNENFFKDRIIYSFLPYGIKACVNFVPKIILNVCGNNIISYKNDISSEDYITILTALYAVIIIQEIILLIRRESSKESNSNEYTPKTKDCDYEEGRSFIYHIFGDFSVIYFDLPFAKKILSKESWKIDNNDLKDEFLRFLTKKEDDIINTMKIEGGIKCYDSTFENKGDSNEIEDFCCRLTTKLLNA